ncbi:glycosyltransferase family 2 protein [Lonepinella sp. BR2357]|uniref:glycosyltransferase family 2 protein n=1 Tax=Lonepinella sp. BR2357 TaxID=3434549 RepID=UPI003F6DC918
MKFSVLMSLYIKEKPEYLRACLQSLVTQTRPADEILLVLDGAITPALQAVIDEFTAILPLKLLPLAQNVGLGKALNQGIQAASHDWIFRMDTDDICYPDRFEKQVAFIEQHPEVVILGGQIAEFGANIEDIVSYRKVPTTASDIVTFTQKRCPFNHMTVAYQRQAVLKAGGYQGLQEDYYLWINLVAQNPTQVANLSDILVYARVGNGMVGRRRGLSQAKFEWQLYRLKSQVKLQHPITGFGVFLTRMLPRLLPKALLEKLYQFIRK